MTYFTEKLMRENQKYSKFIEDFQLGVNLFPEPQSKLRSPDQENQKLNQSVWDPKKSSKPDFKCSFNLQDRHFKKGLPEAKMSAGPDPFQKVSLMQFNKKHGKCEPR